MNSLTQKRTDTPSKINRKLNPEHLLFLLVLRLLQIYKGHFVLIHLISFC